PSRAQAHRRSIEALVSDVDLSDVGSLSGEQLNTALQAYSRQEKSVSQRRREVQHVMDTFNAEIGARYASGAASVDDLLADQCRATGQHSSSPVPDSSGSTDHQSGRSE
ncbi:MAG: aerial mycelium formation protein, partial [Actinomycetota bacterium]|nr:aerial mycelium formation protein [Actinomycetota bacterium]